MLKSPEHFHTGVVEGLAVLGVNECGALLTAQSYLPPPRAQPLRTALEAEVSPRTWSVLHVDYRLSVDRDLRRDSCGMLLVLSHFNWHRPLSLAASVGHSSTVLHAATRSTSTLREEQRPQTVTARQYGVVALYRSAVPFSPSAS
ncbi:hypothetical protein [Streptomyces sp. NPDC058268]|uniref:hypothetical protein n=1 Tax=Streptomyces sp. NPDC058268 TaxID=3346413 RepID=UPI0036E2D699